MDARTLDDVAYELSKTRARIRHLENVIRTVKEEEELKELRRASRRLSKELKTYKLPLFGSSQGVAR